jgi:YrbI family 3-deoxy-D-manno-octulosonate 8-phosphate phosphatase
MEQNKIVRKRANKLSIKYINGVNDKFRTISDYLNLKNLEWSDCWFLGNEINDLEALEAAEISFCPRDAAPEVFRKAHVVLSRRGGEGLLAEIASKLESLKN